MTGYVARWWSRTWTETTHFWTVHRWWMSLAGPVIALLLLAARQGLRALGNARDTILNAVIGVAGAVLGTLLINAVRSPKLLDEERGIRAARLRDTITEQAARIVALER